MSPFCTTFHNVLGAVVLKCPVVSGIIAHPFRFQELDSSSVKARLVDFFMPLHAHKIVSGVF